MKILHICVCGPYTDDFNYQENLLTKYQVESGYEVSLIASQWAWGDDGKIKQITKTDYVDSVGAKIFRLEIKGNKNVFYRYKRFRTFYETIEKVEPDIMFVHNMQFFDIDQIVQYAKKHKVVIYVDNHADFSNSARGMLAKIFYKTVWRHYAKLIEPYTDKFYGVMPSRVDFLINIYGLPKNKCELLVMGGNDELIQKAERHEVQSRIRAKYHIADDDFLIVTGGKIDAYKTQTFLLMRAIREMNIDRIRLLIFGSVDDEYKDEMNSLCDGSIIQYAGWVESDQSYEYFAAADLVVFPGRHSVYWEQVASQGIPMICKYWDGTTHVDIGGNVEFLMEDSVREIKGKLLGIVNHPEKYAHMKNVANSDGRQTFSYREIAKRSVGLDA